MFSVHDQRRVAQRTGHTARSRAHRSLPPSERFKTMNCCLYPQQAHKNSAERVYASGYMGGLQCILYIRNRTLEVLSVWFVILLKHIYDTCDSAMQ